MNKRIHREYSNNTYIQKLKKEAELHVSLRKSKILGISPTSWVYSCSHQKGKEPDNSASDSA